MCSLKRNYQVKGYTHIKYNIMFRQVVNKALRVTPVTSEQLCSFSSSSIKSRRSDFNMVQLMGNVGKQPVLKEKGHVGFPFANHSVYKDKNDEIVSKTSWFQVIVTRPALKDIALKYINKGDNLFLCGSIKSTSYIDSDTGKPNESVFVHADTITTIRSQTGVYKSREEQEEGGYQEEEKIFVEESEEKSQSSF